MATPLCASCGSSMAKKTRYEDNWPGLIAVLFVGVLGWHMNGEIMPGVDIGDALILLAVIAFPFAIVKRVRLWRCPDCEMVSPR